MADLLGIDAEQMRFWLCNRKIVTANETVTKPLTSTQVCGVTQTVGVFLSGIIYQKHVITRCSHFLVLYDTCKQMC